MSKSQSSAVNGARGVSRIWLKKRAKTRSSVPAVCPKTIHNAHYEPFIHADNARSFPWPGKSHIFWFGPLWFALVGERVRVSSHTGRKLWMWPIVKGEGGPGHV